MPRRTLPLLTILILLPLTAGLDLESFRAMYDQPWNRPSERYWSYSTLAELGFDAVYVPSKAHPCPRGDLNASLKMWANGSLEASRNGLTYLCGPHYMKGRPIVAFEYQHAVDPGGHRDGKRPSPVDRVYWTRVVEDVALAIANLSLHYPIAGAVWDTEPYGSDVWSPAKARAYTMYSYDRIAIQGFANLTGREIPDLPAAERHSWLSQQGLLDEFKQWQEDAVYRLARSTRDKVRAINPDFHLGTLGFEDDYWFHLSILEGFSSRDQRVTAWHEDTYYGGYKTGKIDRNHQVFVQEGINGKVIPGLYTHDQPPFGLLQNMAFAMRYNGTFWIFQWAKRPWGSGNKSDYHTAFELLQDQVLWNQEFSPSFDPIFHLYPGVKARPISGPNRSSIFLFPSTNEPAAESLALPETFAGCRYLGTNMTASTMDSTRLAMSDLPCFLYHLGQDAPGALAARVGIQELQDLLELWEPLQLCPLEEEKSALQAAREHLAQGKINASRGEADAALSGAYEKALDILWPYVEEGFADPRNSSIPMRILNKVNNAARSIDDGDTLEGRKHLLEALREWKEIPEPTALAGMAMAMACIIFHRRKNRPDR